LSQTVQAIVLLPWTVFQLSDCVSQCIMFSCKTTRAHTAQPVFRSLVVNRFAGLSHGSHQQHITFIGNTRDVRRYACFSAAFNIHVTCTIPMCNVMCVLRDPLECTLRPTAAIQDHMILGTSLTAPSYVHPVLSSLSFETFCKHCL